MSSPLLVPNAVLHPPGLVGVPCGEQGRWTDFARCLATLERPARSGLGFVYGAYIQAQRNDLAAQMLANPAAEWLFMVDDDHTFDRRLLINLLDRHVDVVGALAVSRKPPYFPCAFAETNSVTGDSRGISFHDLEYTMQEVAAVGTGAILIRRRVFEAIPAPWFEVGYDANGRNVSEDVTFCEKARAAGFKVWLDATQSIGHLTGVALSIDARGLVLELGPEDSVVIPKDQIEEVVPAVPPAAAMTGASAPERTV